MDLRQIQAGEGGWKAGAARAGLSLLSVGWWLGLRARDAGRAIGIGRPVRLGVPVISVGNLTVGGTGKTPFVAWLAERLRRAGRRPGILARGYGATSAAGDLSDEGAVLRALLGPDVPQVEDPDRVRGGRALLARDPAPDVLLLDDGFQHRRLHRDLDVVLLDATNPFGFRRLLPRGLLREPPSALRRAGAVVVTRAERVDEDELADLLAEVAGETVAPVAVTRTRPVAVETDGARQRPEVLAGRPVFAASGIGNPDAFVATLEDLGARVVGREDLADHAALGPADWARWEAAARAAGAEWVVVTRKDAVKRAALPPPFAILDVGIEPGEGFDALQERIEARIAEFTSA